MKYYHHLPQLAFEAKSVQLSSKHESSPLKCFIANNYFSDFLISASYKTIQILEKRREEGEISAKIFGTRLKQSNSSFLKSESFPV